MKNWWLNKSGFSVQWIKNWPSKQKWNWTHDLALLVLPVLPLGFVFIYFIKNKRWIKRLLEKWTIVTLYFDFHIWFENVVLSFCRFDVREWFIRTTFVTGLLFGLLRNCMPEINWFELISIFKKIVQFLENISKT